MLRNDVASSVARLHAPEHAVKVIQPTSGVGRISLEIKEEVAGVRGGQAVEVAAGYAGEQLVDATPGPVDIQL